MPSQKISTTALLALVLSASPIMGYQSAVNRPFARPFGVQDIESDVIIIKKNTQIATTTTTKTRKPTYSLGLGKNKPLCSPSTACVENIEDATRFLVEHESVRDYPSPLTASADTSKATTTTTKPKKVLPKVQLKRKATDSLSIGNDDISNIPQIRQTSSAQLDLNTVWVEMMIHSEQSKLVPAAMAI